MSVVNPGILLVSVGYESAQRDWEVGSAAAQVPGIAGVPAMVEGNFTKWYQLPPVL